MTSITTSIVLYNTPFSEVVYCIELLMQSDSVKKIFIIDNSPSRTEIYNRYSKVVYIHCAKNIGYGRGHNIAFDNEENDSYYHLVMNTDITFNRKLLSDLVKIMESNSNFGLITPTILDSNNNEARNMKYCPSPSQLIARLLPSLPFVVDIKESLHIKHSKMLRFVHVPYISGSFMFFRKSALRKVGVFDRRFFMYPEDIDISRRMIEKYDVVCVRDLHVVHSHRAESKKSLKMFFIHSYNMVKYFNKWGWFTDKKRDIINETVDRKNNGQCI